MDFSNSTIRVVRSTRGLFLIAAMLAQLASPIHSPAQEPTSQPAASGSALLSQLQQSVEELAARASPAVVAIRAEQRPSSIDAMATSAAVVHGSGTIIRADGRILTCLHVVENALAVYVTFFDGRRVRARITATDDRVDLALLEVASRDLAVLQVEDAAAVRRGHLVFSMGNPLGLAADGHSAISMGIVSSVGRPLPPEVGEGRDRYYGDMIQTSALVTPGHSGGPLVDVEGRMIGVLAVIGADGSAQAPVAFAIPMNTQIRAAIDRMLDGESIEHGYIGVDVGTISPEQARRAGLPDKQVVVVHAVASNGPGEAAGLNEGDVIVSIQGEPIHTTDAFVRAIGSSKPGGAMEIEYVRNREHAKARLTVDRRPAALIVRRGEKLDFRGAVLREVDSAIRDAGHLPEHALMIVLVSADSPAGRAGLSPGDIITHINGEKLTAMAAAALAHRQDECLLGLANGGSVLVKPP